MTQYFIFFNCQIIQIQIIQIQIDNLRMYVSGTSYFFNKIQFETAVLIFTDMFKNYLISLQILLFCFKLSFIL